MNRELEVVMRNLAPHRSSLTRDALHSVDWLIGQAERVQELENELKSTINKKNRHLRQKDKRIKHLEWDNMVHRNGHSRLYASLYSLREELKAKNIEVDWRN